MRTLALLATLTTLLLAPNADARLFWQTYGATVAADGACDAGCDWNINQDYFVPRHCDTGRYGLFSECKTAHTRSAACKNLHPVYAGYCTPYGACRYRWRDHVYKEHCGCTPLRRLYGPWHLDTCRKHALVLQHDGLGCIGQACGGTERFVGEVLLHASIGLEPTCLCNVEPFGGETLGTIADLASGTTGGGTAASAGIAATGSTPAASPSILPTLGVTPPPTAGIGLGL